MVSFKKETRGRLDELSNALKVIESISKNNEAILSSLETIVN